MGKLDHRSTPTLKHITCGNCMEPAYLVMVGEKLIDSGHSDGAAYRHRIIENKPTQIAFGDLVEWYDGDLVVNRMGIVRQFWSGSRARARVRVTGADDPLLQVNSKGWTTWVDGDMVKVVELPPRRESGL